MFFVIAETNQYLFNAVSAIVVSHIVSHNVVIKRVCLLSIPKRTIYVCICVYTHTGHNLLIVLFQA